MKKARAWSLVETIKVMATLLPIHSQPGKIKYPLCDIIIINIIMLRLAISSAIPLHHQQQQQQQHHPQRRSPSAEAVASDFADLPGHR